MGMLCAVSFNRYGRLYYFDPAGLTFGVGDRVLVPTDDGPEVAECVWAPQWVSEDTDGFPRCSASRPTPISAATRRNGSARRPRRSPPSS